VNVKPNFMDRIRQWACTIKRDVVALWLAAKDSRTPWYAKLLAMVTAAYALSPIDLIPDFIPVLGYLDDVILVPLGILLTIRFVPSKLMQEYRVAAAMVTTCPVSRMAAGVIVMIWLGSISASLYSGWGVYKEETTGILAVTQHQARPD